MPTVPVEPEATEDLRARFPAALEELYDYPDANPDPNDPERAGAKRRNVFDTRSGLRFVISRERVRGDCRLHVSASRHPHGPQELREVLEELGKIIPCQTRGELVDQTEGGVLHFRFDDVTAPQAREAL